MCPEREAYHIVWLEESGQEDPLQGICFPFGAFIGSSPGAHQVFLEKKNTELLIVWSPGQQLLHLLEACGVCECFSTPKAGTEACYVIQNSGRAQSACLKQMLIF